MNFRCMCCALLAALFLAGCAGSPSTDDQASAAAAPVAATDSGKDAGDSGSTEMAKAADEEVLDPDEVICKRIRKTGTRQTSKVCATRRQWEESAARARESTEKMQRRPQQGKEY